MFIFDLIGALGLFLLGMWLMTEGLKLAGGQALQRLLGNWTSSRARGLGAGVLLTALVQSSSAITVATIGFVNAGLMTFQQSVWVIFGSNVGTTMTAWLVTLFGFSVDLEAVTFPLFGIGAFMRVFSPNKRGQALGMALAGFGLLFMGIDALQETFTGFAQQIEPGILDSQGLRGIAIGLVIGFILTVLTQSSSAAIALILTAVASGLAELNLAAAAVIGANVGTTSTALLATIAATANARRLALAHVLFNLITAAVALLMMPLLLGLARLVIDPEQGGNLTLLLAVFHTTFNLLGVILMWPLEPFLSRRLLRMFVKPRADDAYPALDRNVAMVPDLALRALSIELKKLQGQIGTVELARLLETRVEADTTRTRLDENLRAINDFITLVSQADLSKSGSELLATGFAVSHYLRNSLETQNAIAAQARPLAASHASAREASLAWVRKLSDFAREMPALDNAERETRWQGLLEDYRQFKQSVLSFGVSRQADPDSVEVALLVGSLGRRYIEQLLQAIPGLEQLTASVSIAPHTAVEPEAAAPAAAAVEPQAPAPVATSIEPPAPIQPPPS